MLKAFQFEKIQFNKTRVLVAGKSKAGGPTRQVGWVNRCGCFNLIFFVADNNRTTFTTGNEIHGINVETKMIIKFVDVLKLHHSIILDN